MVTYRGVVEYDGAAFCGSQMQAGDTPTVQAALEAAVKQVTGEPVRVTLASRTDTGVHAEGQVMAFTLTGERDLGLLLKSLNGVLPQTVSVQRLDEAPEGFHPRHDAVKKLYRYRIRHGRPRSPLFRGRALDLERRLDVTIMRTAVEMIEGKHEFRLFAQLAKDEEKKTRLDIDRVFLAEQDPFVELFFEGKAFLRKMVRRLAGSIIEVGCGNCHRDDLSAALTGKAQPGFRSITAKADGLTLVRIQYAGSWPE